MTATMGAMRFTVKERAARFQRRYTGPWQTKHVGSVSVRYRKRRRIEYAEFDVAWHDAWTHALLRRTMFPILRPVARWLARHLA